MTTPVSEIIGFDIGHGESAVARVIVESAAEPEMLELFGERSQVSAIATHPALGVLVGKQALRLPDARTLDIGFKSRPGGDVRLAATLQAFAAAYGRLLQEHGPLSPDVPRAWVVGCPSGWSPEDREQYERIMRAAELPGVRVVAESRAAFLQARDSGRLTAEQLRSAMLVIDIGSSTTDFTLVADMRERAIVDAGETALGAALIDEAILRQTLEQHSRRADVEAAFAQHPPHRAHGLLACRRAKEEYFRHEALYEDERTNASPGVYEIDEELLLKPRVNAPRMRQILSEPMPALGGLDWPGAYRLALHRVRDSLAALGRPPACVLLTGGASRMRFTQTLVRDVFPAATLVLDAEPEYCIARGLARVGRWDLRVAGFQRDIDDLCRPDGPLACSVANRHARLSELLADALAGGLVDQALHIGLADWRQGRVRTLAELERHVLALAGAWMGGPQEADFIAGRLTPWIDAILADVVRDVDAIGSRYHIPAGTLAPRDFVPDLGHVLRDASALCRDLVGLEYLTRLIGVSTGALVAILIGSLAHLSLSHPIGWLVLLTGALGVSAFGTQRAREQLRQADLPAWVRRAAISERGMERRCLAAQTQVRTTIDQLLRERPELLRAFEDRLADRLRTLLHQKADDVAVLIR